MMMADAIGTLNNGLVVNTKKKRNLPGNPDPEAEVIALSPKTLMTTNRFVCEVCGKGFPRDQNLQLHRRGHNLPWKLKQRNGNEVRKRVYVCPEKTCVHHHASRALGDLTGIKKHFCRKHGEKKWKCQKCSKKYAVQSDWKAHSKTCGTREYTCDCGTVFSRRDSFITHRAFCDALAEEAARVNAASHFNLTNNGSLNYTFMTPQPNMSNLFKPFPTKDENEITRVDSNNNTNIDQHHQLQKVNSHPLWFMSQGDPNTLINHPNNPLLSQQIPLSNPFQQEASNSYQMNWFLGGEGSNKMCQEPLTCGSLPLMSTHSSSTSTARDEVVFGSVSLPSIYSNQHMQASSSSTPHMSATALLQKAAQIGATTTTNEAVFMMNEAQDHGHVSRFGGAGSGNSTTTNLVGSDVESTENVFSAMSSNNKQVQMVDMFFGGAAKRRRVMDEAEEGGQTRDFLGVGVESLCHPSPISEWI